MITQNNLKQEFTLRCGFWVQIRRIIAMEKATEKANLETPFGKPRRETDEVFEVSSFYIPLEKSNRAVCIGCNVKLPEKYSPDDRNIAFLGVAESPKERYNILSETKKDLESLGYLVDFKTLKQTNISDCPYNKSRFYEKYKREINPLLKEKSPLYAREDIETGIIFPAFPELTMTSVSDGHNSYFTIYKKEKWFCFWNSEKEAVSEKDLKEFLITKALKLKIDQRIVDKIKEL